MDGYPSCEIEVRGYRLLIYFDRFIDYKAVALRRTEGLQQDPRGAELKVFQACHNKWGKQFRGRGGSSYTFERCQVCGQRKTERFFYDEIRPLLPAEWWQPI